MGAPNHLPGTSTPISQKEIGNKEFNNGQYLKAAAAYTIGLREEPDNAVLYSNRAAALLKLNKVHKALADAEQCIRCKPDWHKAYFRKAAALEALAEPQQALAAYQLAAKLNPDSKEVTDRIRALTKQTQQGRHQQASGSAETPVDTLPAAVSSDEEYVRAKAALAAGSAIPLTEQRIVAFGEDMLTLAAGDLEQRGLDLEPCVYYLPGVQTAEGSQPPGQVKIKNAFDSPEMLANCTGFLRQYAEDTKAHAAACIVPKQCISYPQVWSGKAWRHRNADGVFIQLEAAKAKLRRVWFVPFIRKSGVAAAAEQLSDDFRLLETLFK